MNSTAQPDLDPQAPLPSGQTLVASRSTPTPRTGAEVESNRALQAAARARGVRPVRGDVEGYLNGVCLLRVPVRCTGVLRHQGST